MLNRLLSGHAFPFVHIAYGWELGIPGQIAEGAVYISYASMECPDWWCVTRSHCSRSPPNRAGRDCALVTFQQGQGAYQPFHGVSNQVLAPAKGPSLSCEADDVHASLSSQRPPEVRE